MNLTKNHNGSGYINSAGEIVPEMSAETLLVIARVEQGRKKLTKANAVKQANGRFRQVGKSIALTEVNGAYRAVEMAEEAGEKKLMINFLRNFADRYSELATK